MFNWVKGIFKNAEADTKTDAKMEALLARYEQELLAQEQVRFMQFTVALSNALFPGDNAAVDRVERALHSALGAIAE